jgi:hypothetical protein
MCCQDTKTLNLPAEVIDALARYRRLLDERGRDWGDEQPPDFFRWARFSLLGPLFESFAARLSGGGNGIQGCSPDSGVPNP